jgi:hypothetical protein
MGSRAAQRLGVAQQRMQWMLDGMPPGARRVAQRWFDGLEPQQAKAVIKALVGK